MLRYTTDRARPGLVALYDILPGNGAGQFLQPRSPHGASISLITKQFTKAYHQIIYIGEVNWLMNLKKHTYDLNNSLLLKHIQATSDTLTSMYVNDRKSPNWAAPLTVMFSQPIYQWSPLTMGQAMSTSL